MSGLMNVLSTYALSRKRNHRRANPLVDNSVNLCATLGHDDPKTVELEELLVSNGRSYQSSRLFHQVIHKPPFLGIDQSTGIHYYL